MSCLRLALEIPPKDRKYGGHGIDETFVLPKGSEFLPGTILQIIVQEGGDQIEPRVITE